MIISTLAVRLTPCLAASSNTTCMASSESLMVNDRFGFFGDFGLCTLSGSISLRRFLLHPRTECFQRNGTQRSYESRNTVLK